MIISIEEVPQLQPAVCSFLGFGAGPGRSFIRLVAPDTDYDTLLMSDVAFDEIAKVFGYVKKTVYRQAVIDLRAEINATQHAMAAIISELDSFRAGLPHLTNLESSVENLKKLLGSITERTGSKPGTVEAASEFAQ